MTTEEYAYALGEALQNDIRLKNYFHAKALCDADDALQEKIRAFYRAQTACRLEAAKIQPNRSDALLSEYERRAEALHAQIMDDPKMQSLAEAQTAYLALTRWVEGYIRGVCGGADARHFTPSESDACGGCSGCGGCSKTSAP